MKLCKFDEQILWTISIGEITSICESFAIMMALNDNVSLFLSSIVYSSLCCGVGYRQFICKVVYVYITTSLSNIF